MPEGERTLSRRERASRALVERLHRDVVADPGSLDRASAAGATAVLLAVAVHAVTVLLILGAVAVVALVRPWWWGALLGLPLAALAWLVLPRPPRMPEGVRPAQSRTLEALVARIAAAVGTVPPHAVVVSCETNAGYTVVGLRRRRVLVIGLPLWVALGPEARVAVLAHELGHAVNGDARRGLLVGSALDSLGEWAALCRYDVAWTGVRVPMQDSDMVSAANAAESLAGALLRVLGLVPRGLHLALLGATMRSSQRAEYRADRISWRVAGREAALAGLECVLLSPVVDTAIRRSVMARRRDVLGEVREAAAAVDSGTRSMLAAEAEGRRSSYDSHPPEDLRLSFVASLSDRDPEVVLTPEDSAVIDAELVDAFAWADRVLYDEHVGR